LLLIDDLKETENLAKNPEKPKKDIAKLLFGEVDERIPSKNESQIKTWREKYLDFH
jgi:hypothetical protein